MTLSDHSRIAFYSDGITEAEIESGEEYGAGRLLAQMKSPDITLDGLLADVRKFANGTGLRDDATAILVRARAPELARVPRPSSAGRARPDASELQQRP